MSRAVAPLAERVLTAAGRTVLALPVIDAGVSPAALLSRQLALHRLVLRRPQLTLVRYADGHIGLVPGAPEAAPPAEDDAGSDTLGAWWQLMLAPPAAADPHAAPSQVRVIGAECE